MSGKSSRVWASLRAGEEGELKRDLRAHEGRARQAQGSRRQQKKICKQKER